MAFCWCLPHCSFLSFLSRRSFYVLRINTFSRSKRGFSLERLIKNILDFVLFYRAHKIKLTVFLAVIVFLWTFKLEFWWIVHPILLWRSLAYASCHVCVSYWHICERRTSACFGSWKFDFLIEGQYLSNLFFHILDTIFLVCDHLLLLLNSDHIELHMISRTIDIIGI